MDVLLIRAGIVVGCISADTCERAHAFFPDCTAIEQTGNVGTGWVYDGTSFTRPAQAPAPIPDRRIANYAFLIRFTDAEAVAIDLASQGTTVQAAMMRRARDKADRAPSVDLDGWDAHKGTHGLEAAGLIAPGRADEILNAPVLPSEKVGVI